MFFSLFLRTVCSFLFCFSLTPFVTLSAQDTTEEEVHVVRPEKNCGEGEKVFDIVEDPPEFPGGEVKMNVFIQDTLQVPDEAKEQRIEGTVYLSFIVCKSGKIQKIKVLEGIGHGCDRAAKKAIQAMPEWEPGRQNGERVNVSMKIPIRFRTH